MEYNSGSNHASNFKIGWARSVRPIWNYEHDYSLNCTTRGPITNYSYLQYCAKVMQANFDEFLGFSKNFAANEISMNFQVTYCFIPPELSNDNSRWTLTSHEISRESSLFSIVNREISEENSLWSLSALTRTKQNTATVCDLLLCKETLRTSEITFHQLSYRSHLLIVWFSMHPNS